MTKYEVPMIWQECGSILIEAETPQEAHDLALSDDYGLPDDACYVEDSAEVDEAFFAEPDSYIHSPTPIMRLQERAKKDPEFAKRLEAAIAEVMPLKPDTTELGQNIAAALEEEGDTQT